ncbi:MULTISPECIES: ABC transporter permease [unclassified Haematospirillum]|uniref:ABC transporter permease n=1 Tax=unclassified Haematospirillum TaxID=2622088 RepID=UPI00143A1981|nr:MULTISPECIES: ABC transporter permease [unclassified Haematospirillum]NKD55443.1 ABC transporter permease [Haematospirillum sp. H4890]NKD75429.1 ABC transporter permease [Haematospirillum sp. H4485]NKD87846.1 ABC transporter permease [Haematospirillum sp. 15-248]
MDFSLDLMISSLPHLLDGAVLTAELVTLSVIIGFFIAVPVGVLRSIGGPWWIQALPWSYIFFFRGTPLLIQIFLIYYGLSQFEAVRDSLLWPLLRDSYWCALIAFTLNTAAYSAEILRGSIVAVPAGEVEAAHAVGMTRRQVIWRIVLPRACRMCLPAYGNEIIFLIKGSALASAITLAELTGSANIIIARTYKPLEVLLAAGLIYLLMIYGLTLALKMVERHLSITPPRLPIRAEDTGPV